MNRKTCLLLGAGASKDAGLPLTVQLAEMIIRKANNPGREYDASPPWVRALNFAYGSMVGYQSEEGSDPLRAVNIESLISALRLLQSAKDHEVAPFVSSWKPGALGIRSAISEERMGRRLIKALKGARGQELESPRDEIAAAKAIAEIARSAIGGAGNAGYLFATAEARILDYLLEILGAIKTVDYLEPISTLCENQSGGVDVITLNYDLTIEDLAKRTGTRIRRGVGEWRPGRTIEFPEEDGLINLYKVHGSLDWVQEQTSSLIEPPSIMTRIGLSASDGNPRGRPWIVIGEREKLSTDGPMLALMHAAEVALERATHLVVIGYSFSDNHINSLVRNWMAGDPSRTIGVVDPAWGMPRPGTFSGDLLQYYGYKQSEERATRVFPAVGGARAKLADAISVVPRSKNGHLELIGRENLGDKAIRVELRLHDISLSSSTIRARARGNDGKARLLAVSSDIEEMVRQHSEGRLLPISKNVGDIEVGGTIEIFVYQPDAPDFVLEVQGIRVDAIELASLNLPIRFSADP